MSTIYKRQPTAAIKLDASHPLHSKLLFAVVPGQDGTGFPPDLVSGRVPTPITASSVRTNGINAEGRYQRTTASSQGLTYGRTGFDEINSTDGFTIVMRGRNYTNGSPGRYMFNTGPSGSTEGIGLRFTDSGQSANNGMSCFADGGNATKTPHEAFGANSELYWHNVALRHKGAATVADFFVEGVLVAGSIINTTVTAHANRVTRLFASRNTDFELNIGVQYLYVYQGELTAGEIRSLTKNPYQILKPKPRFAVADVPTDVRFGLAPKVWTRQPPAETPIDWTRLLTKGLLTAIPFNDPGKQTVRAQTRKLGVDIGTNPGTNDWTWTGRGTASVLRPPTPAISNALDFDIATASPASGLSVYWLGEFLYDDAMPDSQDIWFIADTENSGDGWRITKANTAIGASADEIRFRTGELTNTNRDTAFAWEIGDLMSLMWTWDGITKRIYRDGVQVDSIAATGTLTYAASAMRLGNQTTGLAYENASGYQLLLVYDRALTPTEAMVLHKNPWQIFEPQLIHTPINEALPAVATIEPDWTRQP